MNTNTTTNTCTQKTDSNGMCEISANRTTSISDNNTLDNFYVQQFQTSCLSVFSYYIESDGEAIIIDPLRDIEIYLDILAERKTKLKYIFETHFHADFVSGHIDLSKNTGAPIVYGPGANPKYEIYEAKDNEILKLGKIEIKVLHTPGHTLESSCYLLINNNKPYCVFTGDTVFLGDVGRPDLSVKSELTMYDLAGLLYDSVQTKIKTLDDDVIIYPSHGAGSSCGKNIGTGVKCTVGVQREKNYGMQEYTKEEFVEILTTGIAKPPSYFFYDSQINREGYQQFSKVVEKSNKPIPLDEFEKLMKDSETVVLDARDDALVPTGYISGSISVSYKAPFAVWVGKLIKSNYKILLVCDEGREKCIITRLGRIGYDSVIGYLEGGYEAWQKANKPSYKFEVFNFDNKEEVKKVIESPSNTIIDCREKGEVKNGVIGLKTINCPLSDIENSIKNLPNDNKDIYIYCLAGTRSLIACSVLQSKGIKNKLYTIQGGFSKMKQKGYELNDLKA